MIQNDMPLRNTILQTLTINEYNGISAYLERVQIFFGEILYEVDEESPYVYFPTSSVISLFALLENGSSSEIAAIDNKGSVGAVGFINGKTMQHMAVVTKSGISYRLEKHHLTQKIKSLLFGAFNTRIYRFKPTAEVRSFAA